MPEDSKSSEILEMKFDPSTIQHLGVQMYYTLPPVIAEIIANSYDADAENVTLYLNDESEREIIIVDDGNGMSFPELNSKFLMIGRNCRLEGEKSSVKKRFLIGKKGLGKLSFFGIANEIVVETIKDSVKNMFSMNIEDIKKEKSGVYHPSIIEKKVKTSDSKGTKVVLRNLKRKSAFDVDSIAVSLARSFCIFDEKDFQVRIIHNGKKTITLKNDLKYSGIVPLIELCTPFSGIAHTYLEADKICGKVIVSQDSTIPSEMRGIALFSRGKLVNDYSFYDVKATSHGYSYITGTLDVSFIDDWTKDVISTNRRSLNWEDEDTVKLKEYLNEIIHHIYNEQRKLRKQQKKQKVKEKTGVDIDVWIEELPAHERKLAIRMVDNILESEGIDADKAGDLIEYVKDSFQFESFKEFAAELEGISEISGEDIIDLLKEWKIIEAREFYKLSMVRIEAIKKFEVYIKENAKEVPTVHNFFKSFSWLLDPRIIEFEDEKTYSNLLKEKFNEKDVKLETDKRIDFLCTSIANSFFIIELKRPHHVITAKDIEQANEYAAFIEKHMGTGKFSSSQIVTYVVCGQRNTSPSVERMIKTYDKAGDIYIRTYSELLTIAQKYHKEFIKKYDDFRKAESGKGKRAKE